jgi:hypothetical protein
MDKKLPTIALCATGLLAIAFAFDKNAPSRDADPESSSQSVSPQKEWIVPEHAAYDFLFRKVVRLREKTRELQAQGRVSHQPYFPLQRESGLNEAQATALEAIAFACQQEVARQDEKAKAVIEAFQARFPGGRVPKEGNPPLPPELQTMWEERNATILRARDRLRAAFGEEAFARFDNYVKFRYGTNTGPVSINSVTPRPK